MNVGKNKVISKKIQHFRRCEVSDLSEIRYVNNSIKLWRSSSVLYQLLLTKYDYEAKLFKKCISSFSTSVSFIFQRLELVESLSNKFWRDEYYV